MPIDLTSRYTDAPIAESSDRNGSAHPTIGLRLTSGQTPAIFSHRLTTLETLELIAYKQFNNSSYWWRIADANPRVFPLDWNPGDAIRLPGSTQTGQVSRTRKF
jgi:hypothetical protein